MGFYEDIIQEKSEAIANLFTIGVQIQNNYLFELGCNEIEKLGLQENNKDVCAVAINRLILENVDILLDADENINEDDYANIFESMIIPINNLEQFGLNYENKLHITDNNYFKVIDTLYESSQADKVELDEDIPLEYRDEIEEEINESNKALAAINALMETLDLNTEDTKEYQDKLVWFSVSVNYLLRKHSCFSHYE